MNIKRSQAAVLTAVVAAAFFITLTNYNYFLLFFLPVSVSNKYEIGIIVFIVAFLGTLLAFSTANLFRSIIFRKTNIQYASSFSVMTTGIVFGVLQILFNGLLLTTSGGTITSQVLTLIWLIGSLLAGFLSFPFFSLLSRKYISRMSSRAKLAGINALAFLNGLFFTYVTLSLASESNSLSPNTLSYILWYAAWLILPFVLVTIITSQMRKSIVWSIIGTVLPMLFITLFYIIALVY